MRPSSPFTFGAAILAIVAMIVCLGCGGASAGTGGGGSGNGGGNGGGTGGGGNGGGTGGNPPPNYPGNRTDFIRTDDFPNSAVYDPTHKRVFVGEPDLGMVDVISVATAKIEARIAVPGIFSVAIAPDHKKLLAVTSTQKVAWIDTSLLQVIQWVILPTIEDPFNPGQQAYFAPFTAAVPANGKVLFAALEAGFNFELIEWDPVSNTAVVRDDGPGGGAMATSGDGSEVFFAAGPAIYDSATDTFRSSNAFNYIALAAANPDGTQFALLTDSSIAFIDAHFNVLGRVATGANGLVYSADGKRVYITTDGQTPALTTIDAHTFTVLGSAPDYYDSLGAETPLAADDTGLVFGSALGGLVFDDSTNFQSFSSSPLGSPWNASISPTEGPLHGGTLTALTVGLPNMLPDVWFGVQRATTEMSTATGVQATTPPAAGVGTVNVKIVEPNGTMDVIPQAFTYGCIPLNPVPLAAAPTGGTLADIIGFGFGADLNGTERRVTIGGQNANIVNVAQFGGIPRQDLTVRIPPGIPGPVDIVVSSPSGGGTLSKGFRYLKSVTDYVTNDSLKGVVYDQLRQRLYLSAGDHIDVFSLLDSAFTGRLVPPSSGGSHQLTALTITPDGSRLLATDYSDNSLSIINLDNPSNVQNLKIAPLALPGHYQLAPVRVAATSKNTAFVYAGTTDASGGGGELYEVNLNTLKVSLRTDSGMGFLQILGNLLGGSKDGKRIYMAAPEDSGGYVMEWDAATDMWQSHNLGGAIFLFYDDIAVAGDGNVFAINNSLDSDFPFPMTIDSQLKQVSQLGIEPAFSTVNRQGMALHETGSLLYSSTHYGIDVIDVLHGSLIERILLDQPGAFLGGSLAIDESGERIFLITNSGLKIIEMDSVPVSIGSIAPSQGSSGSLIKIRGSGFQASTSVSFNGVIAVTTFVDQNTLQIAVPSITTGAARLTISNSNGSSYTLDAGFIVE